jgi:predicted cation transporter
VVSFALLIDVGVLVVVFVAAVCCCGAAFVQLVAAYASRLPRTTAPFCAAVCWCHIDIIDV